MAVRLQTAEGKIKKYRTTYGVGDNGSPNNPRPEKYVSPCGMEWEFQPHPNEECYHLNCAMYLAKEERNGAPRLFVLMIMIAVILLFFNFAIAGIIILAGVVSLISGIRSGNRLDELCEFSLRGTINGIKAWQVFEDPEETKKRGSSLISVGRHNGSWDFVPLFLCADWHLAFHNKATKAQRNVRLEYPFRIQPMQFSEEPKKKVKPISGPVSIAFRPHGVRAATRRALLQLIDCMTGLPSRVPKVRISDSMAVWS